MLPAPLSFWSEISAQCGPKLALGIDLDSMARQSGGRLVYVATPYTLAVTDPEGRWSFTRSTEAAARAARVVAQFARREVTAVSPVVLAAGACHVATFLDPMDQDFWARWCAPLLAACGAIYVPEMIGWNRSLGIVAEVRWAQAHQVPVMLGAHHG